MNSLTPIISISETLTDENEAFAVINRRCHSLLDFVESYRQLTRIKAPERTTFPISDLFDHIKALFPKVVTVLDGSSIEHQIKADRSQIEQVLINLIKNAFESGATEVEVKTQFSPLLGEGSGVRLFVRDNGAGMPADVLEHAFIPFYTTKTTGTGIGLSLCRQIILKHGGTIHIESEEKKGTTIEIKI
jgi:signal transduction histidine kinase